MGQVVTQQELILLVAGRKRNGERVVFTQGCFDLLHPGHIRCLEQARALGDLLVVGLDGDEKVRQLKGAARPVFPQEERAEILAALAAVDFVVVLDATVPGELIARLQPDVLVPGGDSDPGEDASREEVEANGGRVVSIPREPGHSTSGLLERIRNLGPGPGRDKSLAS